MSMQYILFGFFFTQLKGTKVLCSFTYMVPDVWYKQTSGKHCLNINYERNYQQKNIIENYNCSTLTLFFQIELVSVPFPIGKKKWTLKFKNYTNIRLTNSSLFAMLWNLLLTNRMTSYICTLLTKNKLNSCKNKFNGTLKNQDKEKIQNSWWLTRKNMKIFTVGSMSLP